MKVLVATQKPFAPAAVKGIEEILVKAGHTVTVLEKYADEGELIAAVSDVDAMIVRSDKVTPKVLAAAGNLKIVVRAGAGFDNIDLAESKARGVIVENTPGQNSNAVAELAIAMMIYMSRNQFTPTAGSEISGKRLGIQAFGNVGRLVGKKAEALGMTVLATVKELYAESDFVSVHIPATPETIGSIGYDLITSMPKGAVLVNTARKEVIDEAGLEKALEDRPDLKYVTDVAPDNLAVLKEKFGLRVFATPKKMGAQTAEANMNAGLAAARQIVAYFAEGCTRFQVNK